MFRGLWIGKAFSVSLSRAWIFDNAVRWSNEANVVLFGGIFCYVSLRNLAYSGSLRDVDDFQSDSELGKLGLIDEGVHESV